MPGRVEGTDTMFFVDKNKVPQDRWKDMTYGRIVCDVREHKAEKNRTRLTVGGDRINYPDDCGTPTADLLTVKLLLNSVISTKNAKFMTLDIKNFYLNTPLKRYEYLRLRLDNFPEDVIAQYNLKDIVTSDGYVYIEVRKGMYGLPQAGLLAQELLEKRLEKHGYMQSKHTPGFWTHVSRPICFSLVVDDFGVKYVGEDNAKHLIKVLEEHYDLSKDWHGKKYYGLSLDWDYKKREVHLSMPGYVEKALARFKHSKARKVQDQPHKHAIPVYGATVQYAKEADTSQLLDKNGKKRVQQVVGTFLFYGRAVDGTMLPALSAIASDQAAPTQATMEKIEMFLDYAASHPDAIVTYRASKMILALHSDASYLSEPKARSRAGGHFFLSENEEDPANNGAVLNTAQIIKAVMSSAAEAELGAMFINAREAVPCRKTLEEMGHKQPRTPMQIDNSTAIGVANKNIQPRRTKAMDMRFHWLRDREAQKQFRFYWRPGPTNKGDYPSKHHPGVHHKNERRAWLTPQKYIDAFRERMHIRNQEMRAKSRADPARVC